jgi:transcriptional regulator with XRE-family HTH domain
MDSNAALRQRVWRFVRLGVNQKVLASRMGLSESQLSRWLRKKSPKALALPALDGFNRFVADMQQAAKLDVSTLSAAELEQLEAETLATETEHEIHRQERAAARKPKPKPAGKRLAKKR